MSERQGRELLACAEWLDSPRLGYVAARVAYQRGLGPDDLADLIQEIRIALWEAGPKGPRCRRPGFIKSLITRLLTSSGSAGAGDNEIVKFDTREASQPPPRRNSTTCCMSASPGFLHDCDSSTHCVTRRAHPKGDRRQPGCSSRDRPMAGQVLPAPPRRRWLKAARSLLLPGPSNRGVEPGLPLRLPVGRDSGDPPATSTSLGAGLL